MKLHKKIVPVSVPENTGTLTGTKGFRICRNNKFLSCLNRLCNSSMPAAGLTPDSLIIVLIVIDDIILWFALSSYVWST